MRLPTFAIVLAPLVGLALALTVPACHKDDGTSPNPNAPTGPSAGPAEKTGEKIDEGAHEAKEAIEKGAKETKEGAKSAASTVGSAVEKTGEKLRPLMSWIAQG